MSLTKLTAKQQAFIVEYLKCRNATKAAVAAGYSVEGAYQRGYETVHHPLVAQIIKHHFEANIMSAAEVLSLLAEQARADYSQYFKEDGSVDLQKLIQDGKGHLIKSVKKTRYGTNVEFHSVEAARELILRRHGLLERGATPEDPQHTVQWTVDEWKAEQERRRREAAETMETFDE